MNREGEIENAEAKVKAESQEDMLECPEDRVFKHL